MRRWKNVGWFLALLFAVLLRSAGACETRGSVYIDPVGGNDAQDCATEQTACKTAGKLQTLLNTAQPGAQILLKRGTTLIVNTTLTIDKTSGTADQPIILGAYGSGETKPILDSDAMGGGAMQVSLKKRAYWTIQGLHFKARKGAVAFASASHSTLKDSDISQCDQECIRIYRADSSTFSQHITIKNVDISSTHRAEAIYVGTDPAQAGGSYDLTRDILIDTVHIHGSTQAGGGGECIEFKAGTMGITIQNSTFENNYVPINGCIFSSTGNDPAVPRGGNIIRNNTIRNITGAEGYGIRLRNDGQVSDNTIENTSQMGIFLESLSGYPLYNRSVSVKNATK